MRLLTLLLLCSSIAALSCKKDDDPPLTEEDCADVNSTFATEVQPIFAASCALSGCHDATAEAGLRFDTHANIKSAIENNQQQFLASINFEGNASGWMPRSSAMQQAQASDKLPDAQIEKIECWITRGMPND